MATCVDVLRALETLVPVSMAVLQRSLAVQEPVLSVALLALAESGHLTQFGYGRSACYCLSQAALNELHAPPQPSKAAEVSCLQQGAHDLHLPSLCLVCGFERLVCGVKERCSDCPGQSAAQPEAMPAQKRSPHAAGHDGADCAAPLLMPHQAMPVQAVQTPEPVPVVQGHGLSSPPRPAKPAPGAAASRKEQGMSSSDPNEENAVFKRMRVCCKLPSVCLLSVAEQRQRPRRVRRSQRNDAR